MHTMLNYIISLLKVIFSLPFSYRRHHWHLRSYLSGGLLLSLQYCCHCSNSMMAIVSDVKSVNVRINDSASLLHLQHYLGHGPGLE